MQQTCSSCDKAKAELYKRQSVLLPGVTLYMCKSCIDSKFEPRFTIILAGRGNGDGFVRDYIVKKRYVGADIKAEEIIR